MKHVEDDDETCGHTKERKSDKFKSYTEIEGVATVRRVFTVFVKKVKVKLRFSAPSAGIAEIEQT